MDIKKVKNQKAKIKFSHILLIFTIKTVFIYSVEAIKIKCSNIDDFYFINPRSECAGYYKCTSKGQKEMLECSGGLKFDFYKQSCSHSPGSCAEPSCIGRPNGIYQDTTHACMRSFTCFAGQLTSVDNCPPKHLHNGQKCVQQDLVTCDVRQSMSSSTSKSDKRCAYRLDDGFYASGHNCSEYIVCTGGEVSDIRSCPYDYGFDATSRQCLPRHLVSRCVNSVETESVAGTENQLCTNKVDGPISDPTSKDCTTYIMCKSGKYDGQRRCSNQAVFNGESCVPSLLHECSLSKRHVDAYAMDQCHRKSNGYYAYPQHGCTSYMRCMGERMVEVGVCPAGQYFDMEVKKCIFERILERRRCFERGVSTDCDGKIDGYYTESKCDSYYYCHSGYKIEYKCLPGKVFNGQSCVLKSEYKCPKREGDTFCSFRPDGYYKDTNDGCRAYSYCSNGNKITYICEPGHVFDTPSKKCVRKDMLAHNNCHSDYTCYGKSDGYHIDVKSNCRSYVYCINEEKITLITCRDGKIFNGQKCVPRNEYTCPNHFNHRQSNCVKRSCLSRCESDGFYADISSGCRDFYICINGKSTKTSCQAGLVFNGEVCVAEDKFTCPVICSNKHDVAEGECPLHVA